MPAKVIRTPKYFCVVAPDGTEGDWADIGNLGTVVDDDGKTYAAEITGEGDLDEDQVYLLKEIRTEIENKKEDPPKDELEEITDDGDDDENKGDQTE